MADEPTNDNQPQDTDTSNNEMTLDTVVEVAPDEMSDEQKSFIQENADNLTDEQKETFKSVLETEEKPEDIDPEKVEIKTRTEVKEEEPEEGEEEDVEVDPEDKKTIGKVVDEKIHDFQGKLSEVDKLKDQQEVTEFVGENPEFKPYKGVMLKYLAHPAYRNIPVENIARIVAGDDLQKLGAKKEREAAAKAKSTQDKGTTTRKPQSGRTDWLEASKEDFERKKNEVMGIKV